MRVLQWKAKAGFKATSLPETPVVGSGRLVGRMALKENGFMAFGAPDRGAVA